MKLTEDYLFELGTEELPVSVLTQWINCSRYADDSGTPILDMETLQKRWRLHASEICFWATPRRLTLYIKNLTSKQQDETASIKGPPLSAAFKDGKPTMAAIGFARSQNVAVEELSQGGDGYVHAVREAAGKDTIEVLPELSREVFANFTPRKTMRWGVGNLRFTRPIRWIVALYGDALIDFELDGISAGTTTYGHRFLSRGNVEIKKSSDYVRTLKDNNVLLNEDRKNSITAQIAEMQDQTDLVPVQKGFDALLDEVANMVEDPKLAVGSYSEKYLSMPKEVLYTSMRSHQRYFPLESKAGKAAPKFLVVHNGAPEAGELILKGNQRVLSARLEDAHFFYYEDASKPFESFAAKLEGLVFHSKLGNMLQKAERLKMLSREIGKSLNIDRGLFVSLERAAFLAKADLVTQMVVEFPSLQGVMGQEYALKSGERNEVAAAILEHYLPKSRKREAKLPDSQMGIVVALADKIDSAVSLLLVEKPSASRDPYGIRRHITGWLRIVVETKLSLGSVPLIEKTIDMLMEQAIINDYSTIQIDNVGNLIIDELLVYKTAGGPGRNEALAVVSPLLQRGFGKDAWLGDINLLQIFELIDDLSLLSDESLTDIVEPYIRCKNLSNSEIGYKFFDDVMGELETGLRQRLNDSNRLVMDDISTGNNSAALTALADLRADIDSFFDQALIMDKDEKIRNNRIALLNLATGVYEKYADFSKIGLKSNG